MIESRGSGNYWGVGKVWAWASADGGSRLSLCCCWLLATSAAAGCGSRVSVGDLGADNAGSLGAPQGGQSSVGGGGRDWQVAGTSADGGSTAACSATLDQALPIQSDCPDAVPVDGQLCEPATENGICVWQIDHPPNARSYRAAGCYQGLSGKIWWGVESLQGEPLSAEDVACPKQAPVLGSSCTSERLKTCIYPTEYCECGQFTPGRWLCTEALGGKTSPPVAVERLCPSGQLSEETRVLDLSAEQTREWCQWYADPSGAARRPISGRDSLGVADSYPYAVLSTPEGPVCLADLPVDLCVQNLATRPCTATLAALDDCVETIRAAPSGWVGHGCAPLLANITCSGIIVQRYNAQSKVSQCAVPLTDG